MTTVLVIGGYGGFGASISERLAEAGHVVLVAGRSKKKAERFCADSDRLRPLNMDRAATAEALERHRPDVVVDASGPFQGADFSVVHACIAKGIAYCDIADARDFVCGMRQFDKQAKDAGVAMISGASSVPALSGAVVRELVDGMEDVRAVEIEISASNRASAGPAVARAILGQVGKPFDVMRGGRSITVYGWQEMETTRFDIPGEEAIERRKVALVDVPDVALLPHRLPGRPSVRFRAGTELGWQNRALRLASWPVRWGWIDSLAGLAPHLSSLQHLTVNAGSDRSAMRVRLFGNAGGLPVERRWTLIASHGDGPQIPSLSVPLIIERILDGSEPPGARDAGNSLALADYRSAFDNLSIRQHREEIELPPPLYKRVMGGRFDDLSPFVRRMHSFVRDDGAVGEARVTGASNAIGRMVAKVMRFPRAGHNSLHVHFEELQGGERWTRDFAGTCFSSVLNERRRPLVERFGPLRFHFDLVEDDGSLAMKMRRWSLFGLPLPMAIAPRSRAMEFDDQGRFGFDVSISLPLIGDVVHYRGWLRSVRSTEDTAA